jgi:hypothetical protein
MISINVKETLQKAREQKQEKPKIKIILPGNKTEQICATRQQITVQSKPDIVLEKEIAVATVIQAVKDGVKSDLVNKCWSEYHTQKLERKKLSSQIWRMAEDGATKAELTEHYKKITTLQQAERELFERARYADQHGQLPGPDAANNNADLLNLKEKRRNNVDLRSKLKKKIQAGQAKNPNRPTKWQEEMERAEAEYHVISEQIAKLIGKA